MSTSTPRRPTRSTAPEKKIEVVNRGSMTYWILLSFALFPFVCSQILDEGDSGMPTARRILLFASFMWACLFLPIGVPDPLTVALALVEVVCSNFVAVLSADLLWNQDETYRITPRILLSVSMITATVACIFFSILVLTGTADGSQQKEEEGEDKVKVFYIGDSAYIKSLTLFVSISTTSVTMLVGVIRRVLNRAFFNVRYNNCVLGALVLMSSASGLSMTTIPSPWNVVVSRSLTWALFTLAIVTRRGLSRTFYAPLRDDSSVSATCVTDACYYPTADALCRTTEGSMNDSERSDEHQKQPIRMCNIISRAKYMMMTTAADKHSLDVDLW